MAVTWHHDVVETLSGRHVVELNPSAYNCRTVLNGAGSGKHTFNLNSTEYDDYGPDDWSDFLAKVRRTLVVSYSRDGGPKVAKYAGVIVDEEWDQELGVTVVDHKEFRYLGDLRQFFTIGQYSSFYDFAPKNRSLRGLLAEIFKRGYHDPAKNPRWNLPVRFPDPSTLVGSESTEYRHYTFTTVEEATRAVQNAFNGPDVYVQPKWDESGLFYWQAHFGNPRVPGAGFDVALGAEHPLVNVKVKEVGTRVLTGVFGVGKGSSGDMRVGQASEGDAGVVSPPDMPYVDATEMHKNESDLSKLRSLAAADLRSRAKPVRQFSGDVLAEYEVAAGVYGYDVDPGWLVRVEDPGSRRFPPSVAEQYVISVELNGDSQHLVKLDYQTEGV